MNVKEIKAEDLNDTSNHNKHEKKRNGFPFAHKILFQLS